MRRTKAEAALTRQAILRSALAVFSTRGYASATLDDVARLAGVTRGAIYWHFDGKAGLFQALLETYSTRVTEIFASGANENGEFTEVLTRLVERVLEAVETDRGVQAVAELALFKTENLPELRSVQRHQAEAANLLLQSVTATLRRGVGAGSLRPDVPVEAAARVLLGMINGILHQWLLSPRSFSLREAAQPLSRIFLHGLARP
ncbi:MAG TPA: TetR family transcriptional regulator [Anaerolineales bacterium]|nr:TetR family transcriptional regulator [Anaerolineales bacterium]